MVGCIQVGRRGAKGDANADDDHGDGDGGDDDLDDLDDGDDDDIGTLHPEGGQKEMAPWCANSARSGRW